MNNQLKASLYNDICTIIDKSNVRIDEPMNRHTTFRIGGPADIFVEISTVEEAKAIVKLCKTTVVPYYILGNGSNLLVGDKGFRGVVIQIYKNMNQVVVEGNRIRVQAGALLSKIAREALANELKGFEFAAGIPGTVGGAIVMNAGAYGGEMKDILTSVTVLDGAGEVVEIQAADLALGYRTSILEQEGYVALEAVITLEEGNRSEIEARMEELKIQRVTKQPLEFPSGGSTFKRPEGHFAGKLIQDAGLRGYAVGDAQVSEKHCGFVINRGTATAADVLELVHQVSEKVAEQFGVSLELEIKQIGEY